MRLSPLADRMRPTALSDVVGQRHLLAPGKILYNMIQKGSVSNMIFYGPSGTGKTTVANIIAKSIGRTLYKLNATTAGVSDIKDIFKELDGLGGTTGGLLYLDEIQNFNKKQQQSLLEYIENGKLILIASTTENPYFYIYNAILSRSNVFEFMPILPDDMVPALERAVRFLSQEMSVDVHVDDAVIHHIAMSSGGDVRKALNALELAVNASPPNANGDIEVSLETAAEATRNRNLRYDRQGDDHYDILSAFQKSIRGSDPDAAVHYLARLVQAGDLQSIIRRLLVIAAEDIGLAYPQAIAIVKACTDAALQLGFPEARIPLSEAVLLLANAPKSNSAICAIDAAIADIRGSDPGGVPDHLKDAHYSGAAKLGRGLTYLYPHSYDNHYVEQTYLPEALQGRCYYTPGQNKNEQAFVQYWKSIKKK